MADHFEAPELNDLHAANRQRDTTENGSCLTGHEGKFRKKKNKSTCNYRYQAYEQALAENAIRLRLESYQTSKVITTSVYQTEAGGWAPSYYCATLPIPDPANKDWHVIGPTKAITRGTLSNQQRTIPSEMNFSQDTWPYWNNAHHLIPKGLFNSMIESQDEPVPNVMRKALMTAKYNINHKINMFLLPQDKEVAAILHLTRHIQLRHDDARVAEIFTDHPVYNRMVKQLLNSIITDYKQICDKPSPDGHKIPKADLDKAKLEKLSDTLMHRILDWGIETPGASLDSKADDADFVFGD